MTATPSTRTGTTSLTRSSLQTSAPSLTRTTSSCSTKSGTRTQPFLPLPSSRPQPLRRPRVRQRPLFRRRVAASSFHRTTKLTAQPTTSRSSASSSRGTSAPPSSSACRPTTRLAPAVARESASRTRRAPRWTTTQNSPSTFPTLRTKFRLQSFRVRTLETLPRGRTVGPGHPRTRCWAGGARRARVRARKPNSSSSRNPLQFKIPHLCQRQPQHQLRRR